MSITSRVNAFFKRVLRFPSRVRGDPGQKLRGLRVLTKNNFQAFHLLHVNKHISNIESIFTSLNMKIVYTPLVYYSNVWSIF